MMIPIDRAKLDAIRANCDLIESLEGDDVLVLVAHRALYDLAGKALSGFAISKFKALKIEQPRKDSNDTH